MKNRLFLQLSLLALVIGAFLVNGCKDTATDPGYIALAEIRFADYRQITPIQVYMYPQNSTSADSASKTPTPMTYGYVTPYFNNLPTNRTSGERYHLVAMSAGTKTILADEYVTLFPGDKKTWLISGDGGPTADTAIINDNPPSNQDQNLAYFRFLNVNPDFEPQGLTLMIGDPLSGTPLAIAQHYRTASAYLGIPVTPDTSVTFYVVDPKTGTVLSRLAGVGLSAGTYFTLTWGGSIIRIPDPITGNLTLNDTVRIRIIDDNQGNDATFTPPLTFRYNIINALVVPTGMVGKSLDYTTYGGLDIVINNNTVYDFQKIQPFQPIPYWGNITQDGVFESVPTTTPLIDLIYIKMVKPFPGGNAPSVLDTNLFRLFTQRPIVKSDELYSIVVFDTARPYNAKAADNAEPYDSAAGTVTVPIPDVPIAGSARIILGNMIASPYSGSKTSNNNGTNNFSVNGIQKIKVKNVKTFDSSIVVVAGNVDLEAKILETDVKFSFNADSGGIYEAFLVGQRLRPDGNYGPRFLVVKVNPK